MKRVAVLFCLIGILLGGTVGCDSGSDRVKQAILRVLNGDKQLTKQMVLPPKPTPSQIAWAYGQYCNGLEKLEMSDCPADFRVAYKPHMRAWREAQTAFRELPDDFFEGLGMGFLNVLKGEPDGGQGRLEGAVRRAQQRVKSTWEDVERIAAKYGAAI